MPVSHPDDSASAASTRNVPRVSVFLICQNEAGWIEGALRSVAWADQIVVVDSGSLDGTLETVRALVAEGLPIELHERDWPGFTAQKQWALERCTGEWVLNLDADEACEAGFGPAFRALVAGLSDAGKGEDGGTSRTDGIRVGFRVALHGHGPPPPGVRPLRVLRAARRVAAAYDPNLLVHERMSVDGKTIDAPQLTIAHRRTLPFGKQVAKEIGYADLKARQLHARGVRPRPLKLLVNPPFRFLRSLVLERLFLAGLPGVVRAFEVAIYALATEVRLIELWRGGERGE